MLDPVAIARELELLATLHGKQKRDARDSNRIRFPAGKYLDVLNEHFPNEPGKQQNRVTFAENEHGETIGKRAEGPWQTIHWQGYQK